MNDEKPTHDETQPIGTGDPATTSAGPSGTTPETAPAPTAAVPASAVATAPATAPKSRFVDRLWGLRSLVAVALASVIVGGLGGAALAHGQGRDDRGGFGPGANRGGPGFGRNGGGFRQGGQGRPGGFGQQAPNGQQGQLQPGQPGQVVPGAPTTPTTPSTPTPSASTS